MNMAQNDSEWRPEWFTPEAIDTVIFAFPDTYGRLMGKRMTYDYFLNHALHSGMHACNYLMTVDMDMNARNGFSIASWEKGFGDFLVKPDLLSLRRLAWQEKTAILLGDLTFDNGDPVAQSPRQVLTAQIDRLKEKGLTAFLGSELEFSLFNETYVSAREKAYRELTPSSDYAIDYHILQPARDEDVIGRIRNDMADSGIGIECSKGETARGQHEINLVYADAMEMADRHTLYKAGAKDIAAQSGKAISFMAKMNPVEAGNGFHIHISLWDPEGNSNLFWDSVKKTQSSLFYQFLGGLLKYSSELSYFFAPTINSYKRYQAGSWAPTAIVCGIDNRTCGYRIVGNENSMRIENRMPGADANPYLAFAATLAAGLAGVEEDLQGEISYRGNAYEDPTLPRLPTTLDQAAELLSRSRLARQALGSDVIDFYAKTAELESEAFRQAVTDWEHHRYFEQI